METNVASETLSTHPDKVFGVLEESRSTFGWLFRPRVNQMVGVSLGKRLFWQARVMSIAGFGYNQVYFVSLLQGGF